KELRHYDVEIASVRAQLHTFESQRAWLKAYYANCRGLLVWAPIHRLPGEILVKIFGLC
ncbi:hypothetical protein C8R43DRAFT_842949, partial [Mycena crocata]